MKYTLTMEKLTKQDAAQLKSALRHYEIDISQPELFGVWLKDDKPKRYKFDDIEDVIEAMIERDAKAAADRGEEFEPNPEDYKPDWFELDFQFVNIGSNRERWAETNLAKYCVSHDWAIHALTYPQVWQTAQSSPAMTAATWERQRKRSSRIIPTTKRMRTNLRRFWRELIA